MPRQPKKDRKPLKADLDAEVLFRSHHTCCKCRESGKPVQIHHIDEDPSHNVFENLAVLCLTCHNETMVTGGFGKKLKEAEVIRYRDDWLQRVETRRNEADRIATEAMANGAKTVDLEPPQEEQLQFSGDENLVRYVDRLPVILAAAYSASGPLWSGTTVDMITASEEVIEVVMKMLVNLSAWWPENHFGEVSAEEYFNAYLAERATWCRALAAPLGYENTGSIYRVNTTSMLCQEMEEAVVSMVSAYFSDMTGENIPAFDDWKRRWEEAKS